MYLIGRRSAFHFLRQIAGVGAFVCALSCILVGCGQSNERVSKEGKKSFEALKPEAQSGPDWKKVEQAGLRTFDVIPGDSARGRETPTSQNIVNPATSDVPGQACFIPVEEIPALPGIPALTSQELDALRKSAAIGEVELDAMEVMPPGTPAGSRITLGEIKANVEALSSGLGDLDNVEVVPPAGPGERGTTLGEIKALSAIAGTDITLPPPPPDFPSMTRPAGPGASVK